MATMRIPAEKQVPREVSSFADVVHNVKSPAKNSPFPTAPPSPMIAASGVPRLYTDKDAFSLEANKYIAKTSWSNLANGSCRSKYNEWTNKASVALDFDTFLIPYTSEGMMGSNLIERVFWSLSEEPRLALYRVLAHCSHEI